MVLAIVAGPALVDLMGRVTNRPHGVPVGRIAVYC